MENERAGLVATSYIIGFTTAFIAFAIAPSLENDGRNVYHPSILDSDIAPHAYPDNAANSISAFTNADGLFARIGGEERVLSAKIKSGSEVEIEPGMHVAVHGVSVSPDGRFIHFCEQPDDTSVKCKHYIYRVESDSIVQIKVDDMQVESDSSEIVVLWEEDGTLYINDYMSTTEVEPWYVE